jgi:hypothetical protein
MQDIVLNMVERLDRFQNFYITNPSKRNLANYLMYRDDYLDFSCKLLFAGLLDSRTSFDLDIYEQYTTGQLGIFGKKIDVTNPNFDRIKKWRKNREWRKVRA